MTSVPWNRPGGCGRPACPGSTRPRILHAQVARGDLREHVAKVGGDGQIPTFEELRLGETGEGSQDSAAPHVAAQDQQGRAVSVVRTARTVLAHRASKLAHHQHDHALEVVTEIAAKRREGAPEQVELTGQPTPLGIALLLMRVPAAHVDPAHREARDRT